MKIDLKHIAELAMLQFDEKELAMLETDFEAMLSLAEQLPISDNNEGLIKALPLSELRKDQISVGMSRESILKQAQSVIKGYIAVPKIMQD